MCLAVLGIASAVAGARPAPTGGGAPETTHYNGSDGAGKVTFKVHGLYAGNPPVYVFAFRFANKCSARGTAVTAQLKANRAHAHALTYRFHYAANGITIAGRLHEQLTNDAGAILRSFPRAVGTVRIKTAACDSGTLKFTAKEGKTD